MRRRWTDGRVGGLFLLVAAVLALGALVALLSAGGCAVSVRASDAALISATRANCEAFVPKVVADPAVPGYLKTWLTAELQTWRALDAWANGLPAPSTTQPSTTPASLYTPRSKFPELWYQDREASERVVAACQADLQARLERMSRRDADFVRIRALIEAATPGLPADSTQPIPATLYAPRSTLYEIDRLDRLERRQC